MNVIKLMILALIPLSLYGQEEVFELSPFEITTARGVPPITIKRSGDNLVLKIDMVNDSRIYSQREEELYETIRGMVTLASERGIVLNSGQYDLSEENYRIKLLEASQKSDTTHTHLFAKIQIDEDSDIAKLSEELRGFSSSVSVTGRTEVFPGQIGISILRPEKYRYDVLEAIAVDLQKTKRILGEDFKVSISGLDNRVAWRRVSLSEIEVYIPYTFIFLPISVFESW